MPLQVEAAVNRGLLPRELSPTYVMPPCPQALFTVGNPLPTTLPVQNWDFLSAQADIGTALEVGDISMHQISPMEEATAEEAKAEEAKAEVTGRVAVVPPEAVAGPVVLRRKSTTPRSILDFEDETVINVLAMAAPMNETPVETPNGDSDDREPPSAKRHKAEQELQTWINTLVL